MNPSFSWRPDPAVLVTPLYQSLAAAMERDIRHGVLSANAKLPPQRELARALGLNLSTVTKAYKLCELRGLICAVVGNGTFVSPNAAAPVTILENKAHAAIEMGTIRPFEEHNRIIRDVTVTLLKKPFSERLFAYADPLGSHHHHQAAVQWLQSFGIEACHENTMIAAGVQNALAVVMSSLFEPGDKIATDQYTYPNFISLAKTLHIQLVAVRGDGKGMLPASLDEACRIHRVKGLYLMPAGNNPTNTAMTKNRCGEIAKCIRQHSLLLLEDDNYTSLLERRFTPLSSMVPSRSIYISGLSKPICPGLRIAYLAVPPDHVNRLEHGFFSHNLKISSLSMEIAAELVISGVGEEIRQLKRRSAFARNEIFRRHFPSVRTHADSYCQWFPLPEGLTGAILEARMASRGITVFGAERFSVGDQPPANALRIATCSPNTESDLNDGLRVLQSEIDHLHHDRMDLVM